MAFAVKGPKIPVKPLGEIPLHHNEPCKMKIIFRGISESGIRLSLRVGHLLSVSLPNMPSGLLIPISICRA